MVCVLLFLLGAALVSVLAYNEYRKNKPQELALDDVPALPRDEALRRVPGLSVDRVLNKGGNYVFQGVANGQPIDVEVKLRGEGDTQYVRKIEIQFETRHSHRNLYNKQPIELAQVPPHVVQAATKAVNQHAGSLDHFDRAKIGKVATGDAYDLKGWSGPWEVEVEITAAGQVLELELKNKTGSGLVQPSGAPDQVADCTQADREAIYFAACVVAYADGFKRSEQETLTRIVRELRLPHDVARRTREAARKGSRKCQKPTTAAGRRLMLRYAIQVAMADGKLHERERRITLRLAKSLGVDEATVLAELHEDTVDAPASVDQRRSGDDDAGASPPSPMAVLVSQLGETGAEVRGPDSATSADRAANASGERPAQNWLLFWKDAKWSLFSKSALQSFLLVAVSYGVSAIAMGWQFQEMLPANAASEKEAPYWMGFLLLGVGLLFTFTHGFIVGSLGLLLFHNARKIKLSSIFKDIKLSEIPGAILFIGFIFVWFGGWFFMPIAFLASVTTGLSLAWFLVHLALTKPGFRMIAYIEHGSTCLALLFMGLVFATGNLLAIVIMLVAQVFLLTTMDRISGSDPTDDKSDSPKLEDMGKRSKSDWRAVGDLMVRGVFIVAAIVVVFLHFGWQATIDERREARAEDDEISRQLEAIGGKTAESWSSEHGYVATLIKPKATDSDLVVLKEFTMIDKLNLPGSSITDEGLKNLANVKSIHSLDLSETQITDAGMAHLRKVEIQQVLNLSSTQVTDKTLETLQGLASVKRVLLAETKVAGPGLQSLEGCAELMDLDLRDAPIFDDDLQFIRRLATNANLSQVKSASFRGMRVQLQGTNVSRAERIRLGDLPEITVWPIERKSNEESANDVHRLGIDEAIAINDKYQVVGWVYGGLRNGTTLRRAVLIIPHDANGDGLPDTYLKDSDQDGVNDQLVHLGTFRDWDDSSYVADINNRGQIVGYINRKTSSHISSDAVHRGFVIDPLDTDGDGQPDMWFQDGGDGKTNLLMKDLGTFGGKRCEPSAINDAGQIVGWSDKGRVPRGFVIDPQDVDGDRKLDWFKADGKPRLNVLMVDITGASDYAAGLPQYIDKRGQIIGKAHIYPKKGFPGQSFRLTPRQAGSKDELLWFVDSDGNGLNDLMTFLEEENDFVLEADDLRKTNAAGAFITKMRSGKRRAAVSLPP